jgi:hypothetical protein
LIARCCVSCTATALQNDARRASKWSSACAHIWPGCCC